MWVVSDEEVVNSEEVNTIGNGLFMALEVPFEKQYKEKEKMCQQGQSEEKLGKYSSSW